MLVPRLWFCVFTAFEGARPAPKSALETRHLRMLKNDRVLKHPQVPCFQCALRRWPRTFESSKNAKPKSWHQHLTCNACFCSTIVRIGRKAVLSLSKLSAILLFCLARFHGRGRSHSVSGRALRYDGALAGTGHAAVYLSGVCATSRSFSVFAHRVKPASCSAVTRLSPDTIGSPSLVPYLYAVEKREDMPLFTTQS